MYGELCVVDNERTSIDLNVSLFAKTDKMKMMDSLKIAL